MSEFNTFDDEITKELQDEMMNAFEEFVSSQLEGGLEVVEVTSTTTKDEADPTLNRTEMTILWREGNAEESEEESDVVEDDAESSDD